MKRKNEGIYALYKGDKFITEGTKKEIAKCIGVKVNTISYYNNMVDQTSRNTLNSVLSQIPSSYSMVYDDSYKFKYIDTFDIKGFYKNTHNIK